MDKLAEKIKGFVVLQKKYVLDFNDFSADVLDDLSELIGRGVSFQLVSTSQIDSSNGRGKFGEKAVLQNWISTPERLVTGQTTYGIEFEWYSDFGIPGAIFITNSHHEQFFLNSLTLQVPRHGNVQFDCNSWVYPASTYNRGRVFFNNRSFLPANSPPALIKLRNEELISLRGEYNGIAETERKEWDRVYDYDFYNDLGDPDKNMELSRPVLGGSQHFPYPRRGRTGRPPTETDPATETRLPLEMNFDIYVPRDERFGHLKMSDFLAYSLKSVVQFLIPELESMFGPTPNEFDSLEDIMKLYSDGIKLPDNSILDSVKNLIYLELIKEFLTTDGENLLKYPLPQVIAADKFAWRRDEEFARQMLAGVDPVVIQRLQSFPPTSKLNPEMYGPQISSITASHIEHNLNGLTVEQALGDSKLFILDHHDVFMPYLNRINALSTKIYASRTILFLKKDGTLRPVAIELSLPSSDHGRESVRQVLTPAEEGAQGALWQLAKVYVAINDYGYHQLISHWGMAVVDSSMPNGLKLMIEDYPYAVDGLEIWFAIVTWIKEYLSLYYQNDDAVQSDTELQAWWGEIRNVGHGDKKDETWWYSMETVEDVEKALTTIIWVASALHAAVNFGQYPYAGYMPDRPSMSRRFIPEEGSPEFSELVENPDLVILRTMSNQFQTTLSMALIEILSRHSTDEVYLGQRTTNEWSDDNRVMEAFERYGTKLKEIEKNITERNQSADKLKNRSGPTKVAYTLLYPNTSHQSSQRGLTGKGIPNSISI